MVRCVTLGRIVHKVDFERVLATRSLARSAHFALHYLPGRPLGRKPAVAEAGDENLSTETAPALVQSVDNYLNRNSDRSRWLGCVVPKRHARRAVTRSLLKRQISGAFERNAALLAAGLWLVRLRSPFATTVFVSARSDRLTAAAREELDHLLARVADGKVKVSPSS